MAARLPATRLPIETWRRRCARDGPHAGIFEIELRIVHARPGVLDRGLRGIVVVGALVDRLLGCELAALERLRPKQLVVGECHTGGRGLQRRLRPFQLDLIGPGIDDEEQVALAHDLPVLDLGQRTAHLGPQLDPVDRRELAEETGPDIDLALQGLADGHDWGGRHRSRGPVSWVGRKPKPGGDEAERCRGADGQGPPSPPAQPRHRFIRPFSLKLRKVADLIHETFPRSFP